MKREPARTGTFSDFWRAEDCANGYHTFDRKSVLFNKPACRCGKVRGIGPKIKTRSHRPTVTSPSTEEKV